MPDSGWMDMNVTDDKVTWTHDDTTHDLLDELFTGPDIDGTKTLTVNLHEHGQKGSKWEGDIFIDKLFTGPDIDKTT